MIDRTALLRDLQREVKALEEDLRARAVADEATDARLRREHGDARAAGRTAESFESWREDQITQSAVAWVLACVFVRFLEDNGLLPEPLLSGPGSRRQLALDHRQLFFRAHPTDTDREYLHDVFRTVAKQPAAGDVLGEKHNPLWSLAPSGDGATRLLNLFQRVPPETGELAHDFTDPEWNTRFLGDLYQDLSEAARKKFALLQTPEFVEEFILDRTLTPAIEEFGHKEVRLIDPTCGSGHFLLGAFGRLFQLHVQHEPGTNPRELAQRALDQVAGVDVNPFAVAIARFRLLLAALKASRIERLADAPGFSIHVATGDSLLHGRRFGRATINLQPMLVGEDPLKHVYEAEDAEALKQILGRQYHAVVGNPPYITVKDKALNDAYRDTYSSCHMKYSLVVPFVERFFELAFAAQSSVPAGFVGMIVGDSFMKRDFGKKLIEETLPRFDLTHLVHAPGAHIPGHRTPTVLVFGRNQPPVSDSVRTIMGLRGEPGTPDNPAKGMVWQAIRSQIDLPGSESEFISVADYPRDRFRSHPWALGGARAAELKHHIEEASDQRLASIIDSIGFMAITGDDDAFVIPTRIAQRLGLPIRPWCVGGDVRDWSAAAQESTVFPYTGDDSGVFEVQSLDSNPALAKYLWPLRTRLRRRTMFGKTAEEHGLPWYAFLQFIEKRIRATLKIAYSNVATHNHFAIIRDSSILNSHAPILLLSRSASNTDYFAVLALLNSSTACFWLKQVSQMKSSGEKRDHPDPARFSYEFSAARICELPIPRRFPRQRLARLAQSIDHLATERAACLDPRLISEASEAGAIAVQRILSERWRRHDALRERMVALQEEIDWVIYHSYGLVNELSGENDLDHDELGTAPRGSRPFEQNGGRRSLVRAQGQTVPLLEAECPAAGELTQSLRQIWATRRLRIQDNDYLRLLECLEMKRVWRDTDQNVAEPEFRRHTDAIHIRAWLLHLLESSPLGSRVALQSCSQLADLVRHDPRFLALGECYTGRGDFDVATLVSELVEEHSVPALAVCRHTPAGIRKLGEWRRVWALQRQEDEIDARTGLDSSDPRHLTEEAASALKGEIGGVPVPPKYDSADFLRGGYWRLRGKLDVAKEHFVSFPHCERDADSSLVIACAGWDHLQLAQATAAYYVQMKDTEGWSRERLTPLLAVLAELMPWLRQWHNEIDPEYGVGMGDYFANFVDGEMRSLGLTPPDLESWTPPKGNAAQRKKRAQRKTA